MRAVDDDWHCCAKQRQVSQHPIALYNVDFHSQHCGYMPCAMKSQQAMSAFRVVRLANAYNISTIVMQQVP